MKLKFITYFTIAIALVLGCNNGKDKYLTENNSSSKNITATKDSCMEINTIRPITTANINKESIFEYFIMDFSRNSEIQLNSISFPLDVIYETATVVLDKKDWVFNVYNFGMEFSTILFMNDSINFNSNFFKKINDSTNLISVYLMPDNIIENFYFHKLDNKWVLSKIHIDKIIKTEKESFFDFIDKFASDIEFIAERTLKDAQYITWDENPSDIIEVTIDPIRDLGEDEYLYKQLYIDNFNTDSDAVSIYIKGEGTGYHIEIFFERIDSKWYLKKFVNTGT